MRAFITGVTGQVGSYLAEYLLKKGYEVFGLDRRKSVSNHKNIEGILNHNSFKLVEGDVTDPSSMNYVIKEVKPTELYNMAAMSHVGSSFTQPYLTYQVNAVGVLNILEALRIYAPECKMYQASTSELLGKCKPPQNENTPFYPRSPYGVAKLAAYWFVKNYHESYGLKCASGIMFNTESKRRGDNFVTKKITNFVKYYSPNIRAGLFTESASFKPLQLGNLNAKRDWQHVSDACKAIYRVCNQDLYNACFDGTWKSYCFGSGITSSIRDFIKKSIDCITEDQGGFDNLFEFVGEGLNEKVVYKATNDEVITVSKEFFRPSEVDLLLCDYSKIKTELGWTPKMELKDIIKEMLDVK